MRILDETIDSWRRAFLVDRILLPSVPVRCVLYLLWILSTITIPLSGLLILHIQGDNNANAWLLLLLGVFFLCLSLAVWVRAATDFVLQHTEAIKHTEKQDKCL